MVGRMNGSDERSSPSTRVAMFLVMTTILETKIERLNWLDDAGREERHR
jgi:hypothetical protein